MTRPPWLGLIPAALLLVISVWEIGATRCAADAVPGDAAWADAAKVVRAGHQPGDLIVFAPDWIDPVGRLNLGDLIPVDMAARTDAARYGRIWELSIRGARSADTAGLAPVLTEDHGGVTVRRFDRPPATIVTDLRDVLPEATIQGSVRVDLVEVGFTPKRCVLATGGARITVPAFELGTELVGYVGIADVFTRRDQRQPAVLDVLVGGTRVAGATAGVDDGWVRFAAPTTPGRAEVTVAVRSETRGRLICVALEARR